jgi:squalene synthase HpnC
VSAFPEPLARAYAACEALARSHYENFPVASRLLPAPMRPHVAAVYAFARIADDIADEGTMPGEERRVQLGSWQRRLHDAVRSNRNGSADSRDDLVIVAMAHSIQSLELPLSLFDDLVSAFGQDTMTTRYASWVDVIDYCRRSANPVGRLVLRIGGYRDEALERSSDALCTALQLTNFWQDLGRDWRTGRLYVPREVLDACGANESELRMPLTSSWSRAIESCVRFTQARFDEGRAICDRVRGRLGFELKLTWLGGTRILERVERRRQELIDYRPTLGAGDLPSLFWRALSWRRAEG